MARVTIPILQSMPDIISLYLTSPNASFFVDALILCIFFGIALKQASIHVFKEKMGPRFALIIGLVLGVSGTVALHQLGVTLLGYWMTALFAAIIVAVVVFSLLKKVGGDRFPWVTIPLALLLGWVIFDGWIANSQFESVKGISAILALLGPIILLLVVLWLLYKAISKAGHGGDGGGGGGGGGPSPIARGLGLGAAHLGGGLGNLASGIGDWFRNRRPTPSATSPVPGASPVAVAAATAATAATTAAPAAVEAIELTEPSVRAVSDVFTSIPSTPLPAAPTTPAAKKDFANDCDIILKRIDGALKLPMFRVEVIKKFADKLEKVLQMAATLDEELSTKINAATDPRVNAERTAAVSAAKRLHDCSDAIDKMQTGFQDLSNQVASLYARYFADADELRRKIDGFSAELELLKRAPDQERLNQIHNDLKVIWVGVQNSARSIKKDCDAMRDALHAEGSNMKQVTAQLVALRKAIGDATRAQVALNSAIIRIQEAANSLAAPTPESAQQSVEQAAQAAGEAAAATVDVSAENDVVAIAEGEASKAAAEAKNVDAKDPPVQPQPGENPWAARLRVRVTRILAVIGQKEGFAAVQEKSRMQQMLTIKRCLSAFANKETKLHNAFIEYESVRDRINAIGAAAVEKGERIAAIPDPVMRKELAETQKQLTAAANRLKKSIEKCDIAADFIRQWATFYKNNAARVADLMRQLEEYAELRKDLLTGLLAYRQLLDKYTEETRAQVMFKEFTDQFGRLKQVFKSAQSAWTELKEAVTPKKGASASANALQQALTEALIKDLAVTESSLNAISAQLNQLG